MNQPTHDEQEALLPGVEAHVASPLRRSRTGMMMLGLLGGAGGFLAGGDGVGQVPPDAFRRAFPGRFTESKSELPYHHGPHGIVRHDGPKPPKPLRAVKLMKKGRRG